MCVRMYVNVHHNPECHACIYTAGLAVLKMHRLGVSPTVHVCSFKFATLATLPCMLLKRCHSTDVYTIPVKKRLAYVQRTYERTRTYRSVRKSMQKRPRAVPVRRHTKIAISHGLDLSHLPTPAVSLWKIASQLQARCRCEASQRSLNPSAPPT